MAQHRNEPQRQQTPRKSGSGLFSGIIIGLVIGLLLAGGLAWYLGGHKAFRSIEQHGPDTVKPNPAPQVAETTPPPQVIETTPSAQVTVKPAPSAKAKMDYTFYGILPGEKPAKPVEPIAPPNDIWWLQVAALKMPVEADRLKARLALLGLKVVTQTIKVDEQTLYRVRIGPYKHQDDALADIDTLAVNKFEHRLIKEPANH